MRMKMECEEVVRTSRKVSATLRMICRVRVRIILGVMG